MRQDRIVSEVLGDESVLTPSDLYHKKFRHSLAGGYQPAEVNAYLERVADVLESLIRQVRELKAEVEDHKSRLEEYHHIEETLRSALVASQKFGETQIESARREADNLIVTAQIERDRLLAEASKLPVALAQEIRNLQQQRERLCNDMMSILTAHRTLLEGQMPAAMNDGNVREQESDDSETHV